MKERGGVKRINRIYKGENNIGGEPEEKAVANH
jgi:hypothetical protein